MMRNCIADHMLLCKASTEEEKNVFKTAQALHRN
jgi:hypothetical protein